MAGKGAGAGLVRDTDTGSLLELLLVMSVSTLLVNRAFLAAARYPRIAFGSLHISHMLWGGLLMLVALVMLFRYWNPGVRRLAAFLSGIGFGLFIDELGKFITKDNDYFYQPTLALIYLIFIAMFLVFRAILHDRPLSREEMAFNDGIRREIGDPDPAGYDTALRLYYALRARGAEALRRGLEKRGVFPGIILLYIVAGLLQFAAVFLRGSSAWAPLEDVSGLSLIGGGAAGILLLTALVRARGSVSSAVHWVRRAVLVSIFVTQIFLFYREQLTAVWGLGANLVLYECTGLYLTRHVQK